MPVLASRDIWTPSIWDSEFDIATPRRSQFIYDFPTNVIVISRFLKRYSKAKRTRAPAYSRALRRIKGSFQRGGQEKLRSDFQSTRRGQSSCYKPISRGERVFISNVKSLMLTALSSALNCELQL